MMKNVLIVDNHPVVLKLMTNLLEKEGYRVNTAESGLAALDILKTYSPDIIFTDLVMPNIDGKKLCQIIRRLPKFKDVVIIILSAIAAEQAINPAEFGANACIAKGPFNKMAEHVLSTLDLLKRSTSDALPSHTIGLDGIYKRQITEELLSIKTHFEIILNSMAEGILEANSEGKIVYANPSAVALIGIPEEKLLSSSFAELFSEKDGQRVRDLLATEVDPRIIPDENPVGLNNRQISLRILPVLNGEHLGRLIILNDVSEQKRMEAQLLQAQKMEAIGTLAGGIAHDFNNLLMVIQGNTSLMLLTIDPSHPHYEMLLGIEKQIQSGSKLTSQLLGYARKGKYEVKVLQLNQLVEETSKAFGRTRKEITIHREFAPDLFPIEGDPGQIEQVLMNLLINAADAMPEGGNLFLKTGNVSDKDIRGKLYQPKTGDYVLVAIRDTGMGMDSKTVERIFDPFFTTKELGRGTGLGLASVYGIIKGHDGYIDVESEKGTGTTFKIYLPASARQLQETGKMPTPLLKGTGTILLVDDEESVLNVGQRFLEVMGYNALMARDGSRAIEIYKENREAIALVILDIVMPNMKGGDVFDRLKEVNPDVKVLLSSGYSIDGEATKILERGCNGFIQKPFDLKQLSQSIRAILEK